MWNSIIIISIVGTLAHFLYDFTNHNKIIGLFAAVNESTWEHIKIALTPTLLWGLYDGFVYGDTPNYFPAKLISLLVMTLVIPLIFYLQKIIFKKDFVIVNILSFYVAIFLGQFAFYKIIDALPYDYIYIYLSCVLLFIFFGCYLLLTLLPLKNFLFKDPLTNKYGYKGHLK